MKRRRKIAVPPEIERYSRLMECAPQLLAACKAAERAIVDMWGPDCGGKNGRVRVQLQAAINQVEKP